MCGLNHIQLRDHLTALSTPPLFSRSDSNDGTYYDKYVCVLQRREQRIVIIFRPEMEILPRVDQTTKSTAPLSLTGLFQWI
jgi:hypothetical protein